MSRWQALQGGPLMVVVGELVLVVCSVCYLAWWTITFRPSARTPSGGGLLLGGAVLCGVGGLVLLAVGIAALLPRASSTALGVTVGGGVVVGGLLLYLTASVAHRPVTTELPLIVVWTTMQLATGVTLRTAGELRVPAASVWIAATVVATLVGLACYLVFYHLDPGSAYRVGMVPLALDGLVAVALAATVVLTRTP